MIIGISGKIGSGKDTTAKIIQALTTPELSNNVLTKNFLDNSTKSPLFTWEVKKFASLLKQFVSMATGIPVASLEDINVKNTPLGSEWDKVVEIREDLTVWFDKLRMTPRDMLQKMGTEAMRDIIHPNFWVNALFSTYKETDKWIISDLRFPNEYDAIKERNGICIRVERGIYPNNLINTGLHSSETALDNHTFDYFIDNNGTIENLIEKVKSLLQEIKLL